jgi:CheY-like chemotaxis protein
MTESHSAAFGGRLLIGASGSAAVAMLPRRLWLAAMPMRRTRWQGDPMDMLRCVIVDDDASFLEAAQTVLEADGVKVAGTASTRADAVQRVAELRPDVVLIDIRLGEESGFDAAMQLAVSGYTAAMIIISTHTETDYADLLVESPAIGFLSKAQLSGMAVRQILGRD